jgi:N-acetylglucosamine-6-phosphate deacetylase
MIHSEVKIVDPTTFRCDSLCTPGSRLEPGFLRVDRGLVSSVGGDDPGGEAVHLRGAVVPGLVDLQVNGFGPHDVLDATPEAIDAIGRKLLAHGVTAWLPTIVSSDEDLRLRALDAIAEAKQSIHGARILGAHLEGPWLSPARAGAHDPSKLAGPTPETVERSLTRHAELVRLVTLAPEVSGGVDAIRSLVRTGVVASLGHTDATLDEAMAGIDAGARMVTHLYNAMRPLHHRDPGVVTAALIDDRITCGLIADAAHVHPALVGFTLRTRAGHVALVSDVVSGDGERAARLADGTLAGSLVALDEGVRVAVDAGIDLDAAVAAATQTPADLLGERLGRLEPSSAADFVVLDDDLTPTATYVGGELVWSASE